MAADAGALSPSTQAPWIDAEADAGLSGGSDAGGGWGNYGSDRQGIGGIAPSQDPAALASSPPSGASPSADAGKPNDLTAPVPVLDDQGNPVLVPNGPDKGQQTLRPTGLDPHFFIAEGTADKSYYDALINSPASTPYGDDAGAVILSRELMHLSKFKHGGEWDAQRVGGKFHLKYVDYATVAIGLYAASSGMSRDEILRIQDVFAAGESRYKEGTGF